MNEKKEVVVLPEIKSDIVIAQRGWFQSILFWPLKQSVKVVAKQIPMDDAIYDSMFALAKIEIYNRDEIIFSDDIPWPMPVGEMFLFMQVYLLSQYPRYEKPKKWQMLMESFCFSFSDFEPPEKIYW